MKNKFILIIVALVAGFILYSCQSNKEKKEADEKIGDGNTVLAKLDDLNAKIRNNPENPELYRERAAFYIEQEEFTQAFKDISSALEMDSTISQFYVTLSDVYLGLGKLQKTIQSLEKAIDLDPENTEAYLKMAEMSLVVRDYKKTLEYIDRALRVDNLESKGYLLRGVVMIETGDTIKGILNLQKAIDVNQEYFEAHLQLGILYAAKKNDLAIDYFNNALNIVPGNIDVMYYLAMYYQETEDFEKAIQTYNSILDNDPGFFIAYFNIGYVNLVHLSDFPMAIEYFSKAIEIKPDYAEAYYNRGFAYELLIDVENSGKDYQKTLELHPNYEKAIEGLNRIDKYLAGERQE
jgi:tetratricopeptide (TPR) repeat protein